jgi:hypothetical protein
MNVAPIIKAPGAKIIALRVTPPLARAIPVLALQDRFLMSGKKVKSLE